MVGSLGMQVRKQEHQRKRKRPEDRRSPRPGGEAASSTFGNSTDQKNRSDKSNQGDGIHDARSFAAPKHSRELVVRSGSRRNWRSSRPQTFVRQPGYRQLSCSPPRPFLPTGPETTAVSKMSGFSRQAHDHHPARVRCNAASELFVARPMKVDPVARAEPFDAVPANDASHGCTATDVR
jgi:hypothetical protein